MNDKVYVVTAHRWGDRETHNYIVGIYSTKKLALKASQEESEYRGFKYICRAVMLRIDKKGREVILELPKEDKETK